MSDRSADRPGTIGGEPARGHVRQRSVDEVSEHGLHDRVAAMGDDDIERLLQDTGIIRHRGKIQAIIGNARAYLALQEQGIDFADYLWAFVGGAPMVNQRQGNGDIPATSPESDAMSKALKKLGFNFVGSTICYAFMQAVGMVNDHLVSCPCHAECQQPA